MITTSRPALEYLSHPLRTITFTDAEGKPGERKVRGHDGADLKPFLRTAKRLGWTDIKVDGKEPL